MKSRKNCVKKNVPGYGQTMDECVDIVLKKVLGDKLGQGEQGTVYALGEYVIKFTSLLKKEWKIFGLMKYVRLKI